MGKYVKKSKFYTEEDVRAAVERVKKGEILRQVAKEYRMDKSFLSRQVNMKHMGRQSRKPVFSLEYEAKFLENIKIMAQWGFPLSLSDVKDVVANYLSTNDLKNPFKNNSKD